MRSLLVATLLLAPHVTLAQVEGDYDYYMDYGDSSTFSDTDTDLGCVSAGGSLSAGCTGSVGASGQLGADYEYDSGSSVPLFDSEYSDSSVLPGLDLGVDSQSGFSGVPGMSPSPLPGAQPDGNSMD